MFVYARLSSCHVSRMKIGRKQTTEAFLNEKFSQISLCSKKQRRAIFFFRGICLLTIACAIEFDYTNLIAML